VARRAHVYPQVTPTAAELVDGQVVTAPAALAATDALRLARRRGVDVLDVGAGWVLRADAVRADALGLGGLAIGRLARPLPVVGARDSEIAVRRHLAAGAPAVVVARGRVPLGVVRRAPPSAGVSLQARIDRWLDAGGRALLATLGRLAAEQGARAFAVGGLVRDAWLDRQGGGHDLDVVVEGDAPLVARALAGSEQGGTLVEHERFLTASVALPGGRRVDVVTARSERYEAPGALPRVLPSRIEADLARRDFTVNAMAVELASGTFELLDPLGGAVDLARRRLRILHPLSFVEDPTRIFRAARYAARLGFALDGWSARCRALALELTPYAALSPARVAAELERVLAEPAAGLALAALARAGAFRLLTSHHRATRATLGRLAALPATLDWARTLRLGVLPLELLAAALAGDQPDAVAAATLRGLGLSGAPLDRVRQALASRQALDERLAGADRPSGMARALREAGPTAVAWLHLAGDDAARERLASVVGAETRARPALGGEAVLGLGVVRGPDVATVLAALRDARLDGEIRDRQGEIDYVKDWLASRTKEG
jgi:tRNA nucleotidyltransferase (CCA-adding enzyme)